MARLIAKVGNPAHRIWVIALVVVLLCDTGGYISARFAGLSDEKGPLFVIVAFEDEVLVTRKGGNSPITPFLGMQLSSGDSLCTGPSGTIELIGDQGETVLVESSTFLDIGDGAAAPGRGRSIRLAVGKIWVKVIKLTKALESMFRFSITTPTAFAGVRGTIFSVSVDQHQATEVSVFDGVVEVIAAEILVTVPAGYTTRVGPGRGPEAPNEHSEDQNRAWEKHRQRFEGKPGKIPPPAQDNWQPPGQVGNNKQSGNSEKGQEKMPQNHPLHGNGKPGANPGKGKGPPFAKKTPNPQAEGPNAKGDEKDE